MKTPVEGETFVSSSMQQVTQIVKHSQLRKGGHLKLSHEAFVHVRYRGSLLEKTWVTLKLVTVS